MNNVVNVLTIYNGELIAGGYFTTAGGNAASYIARWDGATWQALGSGMNNVVNVLTIYNGELIAGGEFWTAGGNPVGRIARWNGSIWQALGSAMNNGVRALAVYPGALHRPLVRRDLAAAGQRDELHRVCPDGLQRRADRRGLLHHRRRQPGEQDRALGRRDLAAAGQRDE
jgi:hypothetical protein